MQQSGSSGAFGMATHDLRQGKDRSIDLLEARPMGAS
jgi:hypothetical protein